MLENLVDFDAEPTALDLFAGTGAISLEFLSRGCSNVTTVELAATQVRFIARVRDQLNIKNMKLIKGDVFRFIAAATEPFDIIFADPPYDHPRLPEVPELVLASQLVKPGTIIVMEHPRTFDFSDNTAFTQHRVYGKVNFSIFVAP